MSLAGLGFSSTQIRDNVDIREYPEAKLIKPIKPGEHISYGDLHANALVMLQLLIVHGIFEMSPEHYKELVAMYDIGYKQLGEQQKIRFYEILSKHTKITTAKGILFRFKGDMLCDRGNNDLFILMILAVLKENNVPYQILVSNHDMQFQRNWEGHVGRSGVKCSLAKPGIKLDGLDSLSLWGLTFAIKNGAITEEEVGILYEQFYLPNLKMVSYSLEEKGPKGKPKVHLFFHAPTDIQDIALLAKYFGIDTSAVFEFYEHPLTGTTKETRVKLLKDAKPQALFTIIDAINVKTLELMKSKEFHKTTKQDFLDANDKSISLDKYPEHIVARFFWRREVPSRCAWGYQAVEELPFDIEIHHGHDSPEQPSIFQDRSRTVPPDTVSTHGMGFTNYDPALGHPIKSGAVGELRRRSSFNQIATKLEAEVKAPVPAASILGPKTSAVQPNKTVVDEPGKNASLPSAVIAPKPAEVNVTPSLVSQQQLLAVVVQPVVDIKAEGLKVQAATYQPVAVPRDAQQRLPTLSPAFYGATGEPSLREKLLTDEHHGEQHKNPDAPKTGNGLCCVLL